ncbi:uncharacterized protein THITE_2089631 [Thermothielavioides terrestris NRRL 8126]|uniref:Uncharacterized protein n=1 Tax=Thermothielavioides terrestris (strain ATCC 38088 / NRRL 8126) TaxID=578455 RepID=G2R877_THETT|nr:uncharacterized protein THITE_2089631 [Thermothielavioides terrestris NRRL 8126]AEO68136.1 hypothetical protein THITE_2089631 [Thermothielavioides terrestris NRRL 8126]
MGFCQRRAAGAKFTVTTADSLILARNFRLGRQRRVLVPCKSRPVEELGCQCRVAALWAHSHPAHQVKDVAERPGLGYRLRSVAVAHVISSSGGECKVEIEPRYPAWLFRSFIVAPPFSDSLLDLDGRSGERLFERVNAGIVTLARNGEKWTAISGRELLMGEQQSATEAGDAADNE